MSKEYLIKELAEGYLLQHPDDPEAIVMADTIDRGLEIMRIIELVRGLDRLQASELYS